MLFLKKQLSFENIYFEYEKDIPVIKDLNLSVKPNETIALVGNSGGGKSTIVNLIPRFYDVKSGSIKIDGIDLRDYDLIKEVELDMDRMVDLLWK